MNLDLLNQLQKYPDLRSDDFQAFKSFVQSAPDYELYRVNPTYLAQRLGWALPKTLDVLTLAANENLVEMEWQTFCPSCSYGLAACSHLGDIHHDAGCACGWHGAVHLDQEVRLLASLNERVRPLDPAQREPEAFRQEQEFGLQPVSALMLVNRPLFRELLGEQTLPGNRSLGVQQLSIFFSDLKSSTALYQRLGDARAYELVREHFEVLFAAAEAHNGSAVKTIGDGVMGTFFRSADALQAIAQSLRGLAELNQRFALPPEDRLRLKFGLHSGSCIVVTLNHRLDYFGSTVNIASRLSGLAEGDDLFLSGAALAEEGVHSLATALGRLQPIQTQLRGVSEHVETYRLQIPLN